MTEEQVNKWIKRRNDAKRIEDPVARSQALDLVYELRDEMQLDCFRKQADRIKKSLENDAQLARELRDVKADVDDIKQELPAFRETDRDYRQKKERTKGAIFALRALDYIFRLAGAGGIGAALYQLLRGGAVQ